MQDSNKVKGRFAPSPTGRMHLGNVCAALQSWYSAKSGGGDWLLRIEDLDPQRSKDEYARQIEADLLSLGLEWDEGGLDDKGEHGPYVQSLRGDLYASALAELNEMGLTYPCYCSRADVLATQAPHQSDGRIVYSGHCRPEKNPAANDASLHLTLESTTEPCVRDNRKKLPATRIIVPDEEIKFTDRICGPQSVNLAKHCGDFVVRRADGAWAYQLAVVVDDALMGVTEVVRGEDLLLSSAQQIYLYRLLGYAPPEFAHFPLIRNESGQRLSKRDGAQSLEYLFEHYSPEEIIGKAAVLTGLRQEESPVTPKELLAERIGK